VTGISTVLLAALAGLNPWVVLVIVVGLATFTRHAPLNEPYSQGATIVGLAIVAVAMGIEIVVSKLRRAARFVEPVSLAAAVGAGAGLPLALLPPTEDALWLVPVGLVVALVARLARYRLARGLDKWLRPMGHIAASIVSDLAARYRLARGLDKWLRPMGHIAASIVSDLAAGTLTAAIFALKL
jgi:hypothetical protein